jgi:hypothetical protein
MRSIGAGIFGTAVAGIEVFEPDTNGVKVSREERGPRWAGGPLSPIVLAADVYGRLGYAARLEPGSSKDAV